MKPLAAQSIGRPPTIDGSISNNEWPAMPQFTLPGTKTDVYLAHDSENLYVAARRPAKVDRRGKTLWNGKTSGNDAEIWHDDSWELFIGDATSERVAHWGVSITGARYDAIGRRNGTEVEDPHWNGDWQSATTADDDFGTVELAIPWKSIKTTGLNRHQLAVNFLVNRDAKVGEAITYLGVKGRAGCANLTPLGTDVAPPVSARQFRVRLHFAQPPDQAATRPFDVMIQGKTVASGIDISGKNNRLPAAIIREFPHIRATDRLSIEFKSTTPSEGPDGAPLVCAIEVHEEPA